MLITLCCGQAIYYWWSSLLGVIIHHYLSLSPFTTITIHYYCNLPLLPFATITITICYYKNRGWALGLGPQDTFTSLLSPPSCANSTCLSLGHAFVATYCTQ